MCDPGLVWLCGRWIRDFGHLHHHYYEDYPSSQKSILQTCLWQVVGHLLWSSLWLPSNVVSYKQTKKNSRWSVPLRVPVSFFWPGDNLCCWDTQQLIPHLVQLNSATLYQTNFQNPVPILESLSFKTIEVNAFIVINWVVSKFANLLSVNSRFS